MHTDRRPFARPAAMAVALACLLQAVGSASAQTIYRCGPDGRHYSQVPCADGRAVAVDDGRTAQQHAEAEARRRQIVNSGAGLSAVPGPVREARGAAVIHSRGIAVEEAAPNRTETLAAQRKPRVKSRLQKSKTRVSSAAAGAGKSAAGARK